VITTSVAIIGAALELKGMVCVAAVAIIVFLATSAHRPVRRCPRCQERIREGASYCAQCGLRLVDH
jgi:predicted amidophosphoribosyltransferase